MTGFAEDFNADTKLDSGEFDLHLDLSPLEGACNVCLDDKPQFLGLQTVSTGWLNKHVLNYKLPNGKQHPYEVVTRKPVEDYLDEVMSDGVDADAADAVCVVGTTADGSFLLTREFRYPLNAECIAFPAGLREPGEDVVACAERELREETGYAFSRNADGSLVRCMAFEQPGFSSIGMTDESIIMVFAQVEKVEDAHTEPTEFIQSFELPLADVPEFLRTNRNPLSIRAQLVLGMAAFNPLAL